MATSNWERPLTSRKCPNSPYSRSSIPDNLDSSEANHMIRRVDANGNITTVAGTGTCGFSGDGGPATNAQLCNPSRVSVSSTGLIYIADTNNQRIREVDLSGNI